MRAACVIGWPVEHSRSPLIHNYWLNRYGIAGVYRRELVPRKNSHPSSDRSPRAAMSAPM
jgi:shikimate 5-dehydrogenase